MNRLSLLAMTACVSLTGDLAAHPPSNGGGDPVIVVEELRAVLNEEAETETDPSPRVLSLQTELLDHLDQLLGESGEADGTGKPTPDTEEAGPNEPNDPAAPPSDPPEDPMADPNAKPSDESSESPAPQIDPVGPPAGDPKGSGDIEGSVPDSNSIDRRIGEWGHLPEGLRQRVMNVRDQRPLPGYEREIERYLRSLNNLPNENRMNGD